MINLLSGAAEDQDVNRQCLKSVAQIAQEVYGTLFASLMHLFIIIFRDSDELRRSASITCSAVISNRGILESLQSTLLHHIAAVADDKSKDSISSRGCLLTLRRSVRQYG